MSVALIFRAHTVDSNSMAAGSTRIMRRKEFLDGTLRALAQETNRSIEVVADLYDDEVAHLEADSRVKKFIEVIASSEAAFVAYARLEVEGASRAS